MANRNITTGIWSDPVFADLSPSAQLVFLRLVTGPETTPAGTTQVLGKSIAVDCNLDRADAERALEELLACGLVRRYDDWLWMPGWIEHQVIAGGMLVAARRETRRRGLPRALAAAVTRRLDRRFGAADAPSRSTRADAPRTRKAPVSRDERGPSQEGPDTSTPGCRDSSQPYQYQDPLPSGGGGPSAAAPAPAPGAQAPQREDTETAAVALAEVADGIGDVRLRRLLAAQVDRIALPDAPTPEAGPAFAETLDQEEVMPSGLRRWEEQSLMNWHATRDPTHLAELERGSDQARAAAAALLRQAP